MPLLRRALVRLSVASTAVGWLAISAFAPVHQVSGSITGSTAAAVPDGFITCCQHSP